MKFKRNILVILLSLVGFTLGIYCAEQLVFHRKLISPLVKQSTVQADLPLQAYSFKNLQKEIFPSRSPLTIIERIDQENQVEKFIFIYQSQGKKISGALNVALPTANSTQQQVLELPVIILLRGWVAVKGYFSGLGTKNAAQVFAEAGYLTLAPDFLGYGQSDKDLEDTFEARFIKPINVIDLLNALRVFPEINVPQELNSNIEKIIVKPQVAIWAHSNGGQIAISTLEILQESIATVLWAPVTAPFPYSILFYSDQHPDEGKEMRKYLSLFEKDYDVFDFSITQHLDSLQGPLQIQHGLQDLEAPIAWSDKFVKKIEQENQRRAELEDGKKIDYNYFRYQEADHNLQPNWQTAIKRDLEFFNQQLQIEN